MSLGEQSVSKTPFWYLYIAQANTGRYYVGISQNPASRLKDHNKSKGSRFAKLQGPFKLVYVSNKFPYKSEARKREVQVKGWSRDKKIKLISGEWE